MERVLTLTLMKKQKSRRYFTLFRVRADKTKASACFCVVLHDESTMDEAGHQSQQHLHEQQEATKTINKQKPKVSLLCFIPIIDIIISYI